MARHALTPELAEKERKAVELRLAGCDYDAIAQKLGYADRGGAFKAVQRALKRTLRESAEQVRELELARLDRMHFGLWHRATLGDETSVASELSIMARRAKYLGLDAPEKREVTGKDGAPFSVVQRRDLSALDDADLLALERLVEKLALPGRDSGRTGEEAS